MKYFVGYLIEGEVANYYKKLTGDLTEKFGIEDLSNHIPPHFTFKPPFDTKNIEDFEKVISNIAQTQKPIDIIIYGFERFDLESLTIFLNVKEDYELLKSIKQIVKTLKDYGENKNFSLDSFRLHASVARHLSQEQSNQIWGYLRTIPQPKYILRFDNLTIFYKKNLKWEIHKIYSLKD